MTSLNRIPAVHDPWYGFLKNAPDRVEEARYMRNQAMHYSGIEVGAVGYGVNEEGDTAWFMGANQNFMPGQNETKRCAEDVVMSKLEKYGFVLVAMTLSGPPQPDTHSGIETPTLQPCGNCRQRVMKSPATRGDSLVLPIHPYEDKFELYNPFELSAIHQRQKRRKPFKVHFDKGLEDMRMAAERYREARRKFAPSARLAELALTNSL